MSGRGVFRRKAWRPATATGRTALHLFHLLVATGSFILIPAVAMAARKGVDLAQAEGPANKPIALMTALSALSLAPFVVIMVTSFVKIAVVLAMIRQALGTSQIPPTQVLTGMAIVFTVYVMHPVALQMKHIADAEADAAGTELLQIKDAEIITRLAGKLKVPIVEFLQKHTHARDRTLFVTVTNRLKGPGEEPVKATDLSIAIPAFVITELTEAFQIGLLIFLPFLVIDMTVSNILMALGMQMLQPSTVALPFKLMLFVLVDGWYLLTKGIVLGYQ